MKLNKKTLFRTSLFLLVLIFVTMVAFSQGPLLWNTYHQRPGIPMPTSGMGSYPKEANLDVQYLSSGNVIGAGCTYPTTNISTGDIALRKYKGSDGSVMQVSYIDHYFMNQDDKAVQILIAEPYMYVLATSQYGSPSFDNDIILYKMDTSFNLVWATFFNGTGDVNDEAVEMGMDAYGNIYVVGNTFRSATNKDIVLLKYDPNGANLFTKYFSSSGSYVDYAKALAVEPNGICNITGAYGNLTYGQRLAVIKTWGNGVQLWAKYHDAFSSTTGNDYGTSITFDPVTSDVYVTGSGQNGTADYDWTVVKFSGVDGTKLWSKKIAGSSGSDDSGVKIIYTSSGNLFACGNITSAVSGVTSKNIQLLKINPATGANIFSKIYNYDNGAYGPSEDIAHDMVTSPSGNVFIVGTFAIPNITGINLTFQLVLAYSNSGTLNWSHSQYQLTTSAFQENKAVCVSYSPAHNSLYAGGFKWATVAMGTDCSMMKFGPVSLTNPNNQLREEEEMQISISVFPNPATDFITIKSEEQVEAIVELYDITGKMITKELFNDTDHTLNVSQLPRGAYILRFITEKSVQSEQIILN